MQNFIREQDRAARRSAKKERITIPLSQATAKVVKAGRAETNAPSMSAFLEKIVADWQNRIEQENYDTRIRAHYDSLSPASRAEDQQWGATGEVALAEEPEIPGPVVAAGG